MTTDNAPIIPAAVEPHLAAIADRLYGEFGALAQEFIAGVVSSSYAEIARRTADESDVVERTERFARQRLAALEKVEGGEASVPTVLFLCIHNAGRSQMALGFFEHHAKGRAVAWSGGSEPGKNVNPAAVAVMAERGIDISGAYPKPWTDEILRAADAVITMGCGDTCPYYPGKRYEDWTLEDPAGQGADAVRPIRDDIERRVTGLLESLGVAAG